MNAENEADRIRYMQISEERGDFVTGDDGYVVYWPTNNSHGSLAAHHLRWLADELDRRNAEWDAVVQSEFATPGRVKVTL